MPPTNGIEWLIQLDSKTDGAFSAIAAMDKVQTAAGAMGKAVDRVLSRLERPSSWSKQEESAKRAMEAHKAALFGAESSAVAAYKKTAAERKAAAETEKQERLAQAMRNRDELLAKGRMQERIARINAEIEKMGGGVEKTEPLWRSFFKGELATHALEKGFELAKEAGREALHIIEEMVSKAAGSERGHKVFANIMGSKEDGEEVLEYLGKFSELSEFTDDDIKGLSTELLRAGLSGASFRNALAAAADVAAQAPNKMEGFQEAISSLSRIALVGKVDARTLRGLRLNPHDVEKQLSEDFGLAPEVIRQKLEEGTLEGSRAMASIYTVMEQKTGKQLGGVGLEMANNLEARLAKLRDVPEELFKTTRKSDGYQLLSDSVQRLIENFGEGSVAGKRMEDALGKAMDTVGKVIAETNWEKFSDTLGNIVELSATWVEPLGKIAGFMTKIAEGVLALPTLGTHVGDWFARKLNPEIDQHSIFDAAAKERTKRMLDENERQFNLAFGEEPGKAMSKGMANGVGGGDELENRGRKMVKAAAKGVTDEAEIHSPSKLFERQGILMVEGMAQGLEGGQARVQMASASVVPAALPDISRSQFGGGGLVVESGAITIPIYVGQGSPASADEIVREVELRVPSALLSAFEQIAAEGGL